MSAGQDPGLWYVKGKGVVSNEVREQVWTEYHDKRDALYAEQEAMKERHRLEAVAMQVRLDELHAAQPCTPWVGRADTGSGPDYVASAEKRAK